MNYKCENGILTICLEGRVDSTNAEKVSAEIDAIEGLGTMPLVIDAEALEYISSAGLRMILKLRKQNPDMKITGVSSDVYDIFEMTGFTEMITVEKGYRHFSVDGCQVIGAGAKGTVYRYNEDTIVKVYKKSDCLPIIKNERELARKAFVLGIPTAISYDIVKVGDKFGSVFELLDASSYSTLIKNDPDNFDKYVSDTAELLRKIHGTEVSADDMPDIKETVRSWIKADEPYLDASETEKLYALVEAVPDTMNMLHCDYHTNNIMYQNGEALLIDMDTLSHGHPIFELANIYITYVGFGEADPTFVENFIGLPYETTKKIWKKFLPLYLETEDEASISDVESKAKLLSYVRYLRHTVRRGGADTESGREIIAICQKNIKELLQKTEKLGF